MIFSASDCWIVKLFVQASPKYPAPITCSLLLNIEQYKWMLCLSSGKQMGSISIARPIFKQEVNVQKNKSWSNEVFDLQVLLSAHGSSKSPSIRQCISKPWVSHARFPCLSQPLIRTLHVLCSYPLGQNHYLLLQYTSKHTPVIRSLERAMPKDILKQRRVSAKSRCFCYSSFPK